MAAHETGIQLLSCLRKTGAIRLLTDTPENLFVEPEELAAFNWLKDYVHEYRAFPTPATFFRETAIRTVVTNEPYEYYRKKAHDRYLYKTLLPHLQVFADGMRSRDLDSVVAALGTAKAATDSVLARDGGYQSVSELGRLMQEDYAQAQWAPGLRGVPTGWPEMDVETGGWQESDLITFVGRPGRGKTQLLLYSAWSAWRAGFSTLFVSMELGAIQLARRLFGLHTGINPRYIRDGQLSTLAQQRLRSATIEMSESGIPFNVVAGGFRRSTDAVKGLIHELTPDVVFVDASYLLTPQRKRYGSSGRRESVSDTIEELKMLAIDHRRPIVQTVQFNREAERGRIRGANPIAHLGLGKIGETDVIGQVSSLVVGIELGSSPYEDTRRWVGFLKGREGDRGVWEMNYSFSPVNFAILHNQDMQPTSSDLDWRG